jgi:hypothetical protein
MKTDQINLRRVVATTVTLDGADQKVAADSKTLRALGYRQGVSSLADGGKVGNSQFVRLRPGAMRALARDFVGRPLLIGHDVSNITKRLGTIVDCKKVDVTTDEVGLEFSVDLNEYGQSLVAAEQVVEFSIGFAIGDGKANCTICKAELWSANCYHWPGLAQEDGTRCEVEYTDPEAIELSAVNVGAVTGTMVLSEPTESDASAEIAIRALQVGRQPCDAQRAIYLTHRLGGVFSAPPSVGTIDKSPPPLPITEDKMRQKLITKYGLSADATDDQIELAMNADEAQHQASAKILELSIVDEKLAALKVRGLSDEQSKHLRAQYDLSGLKAFTVSVSLVDSLLPTHQIGRGALQSDKPALAVNAELSGAGGDIQIKSMWDENPELRAMAKGMGLSREQVIEHAPSRYKFADAEGEQRFRANLAR